MKPVEGACPWAIFGRFCRYCEANSRAETRTEDYKSCDCGSRSRERRIEWLRRGIESCIAKPVPSRLTDEV